jgi:hypothetical protein
VTVVAQPADLTLEHVGRLQVELADRLHDDLAVTRYDIDAERLHHGD